MSSSAEILRRKKVNEKAKPILSRRQALMGIGLIGAGLATYGIARQYPAPEVKVVLADVPELPNILQISQVNQQIDKTIEVAKGNAPDTWRQKWLRGTITRSSQFSEFPKDTNTIRALIEDAVVKNQDIWMNICPEVTLPGFTAIIGAVAQRWDEHVPQLFDQLGLSGYKSATLLKDPERRIFLNLPDWNRAETSCAGSGNYCEDTWHTTYNIARFVDDPELYQEVLQDPKNVEARRIEIAQRLKPTLARFAMTPAHEEVHNQQGPASGRFWDQHRMFCETVTELTSQYIILRAWPDILDQVPTDQRAYYSQAGSDWIDQLNQQLSYDEEAKMQGGLAAVLRTGFQGETEMEDLYLRSQELGVRNLIEEAHEQKAKNATPTSQGSYQKAPNPHAVDFIIQAAIATHYPKDVLISTSPIY